jgi:hypothetical protein
MYRMGFEPTIAVFEQAKTVHALERATTVIGSSGINWINYAVRGKITKVCKRRGGKGQHNLVLITRQPAGAQMPVQRRDIPPFFSINFRETGPSTENCQILCLLLVLLKQICSYFRVKTKKETKTKLRGFSPRTNYTGRATAACRRS